MDERGKPRVFTVDTYSNQPPPLPPRLTRRPPPPPQRGSAKQSLLFLLVGLALCGMVIEAYCIFQLYRNTPASSGSTSKLTADEDEARSVNVLPSKPTAHLTYGTDVVHEPQIMRWSEVTPLLFEMSYSNGSLVIQKEGYYYVYSKVSFKDTRVFRHSVGRRTQLYTGSDIALLTSRKYSGRISTSKEGSSNSYLGGVFHLKVGDNVFVQVSNTSKLLLLNAYEHVFGAYML